MKIRFSIIGVIIFILPMLINIVYFAMASKNGGTAGETTGQATVKWLEMVEQITRILYAVAICFLVSRAEIDFKSPWMVAAIVFLVLYYIVWIRYFAGGMDVSLMGKSFLFVPIPLAVFPVLYFLCAAVWMHNFIAAGIMIVFGVSHFAVSYLSFLK